MDVVGLLPHLQHLFLLLFHYHTYSMGYKERVDESLLVRCHCAITNHFFSLLTDLFPMITF